MSRARSLANLANSGVFSADASTSRVGINSSAPERTLDVVGDGRVSGTLSIGGTINYEDVTSIDSIGVVTARQGVHIVSAGASIYSPANNELALYTNSSERVRITSVGSVGIGTDNPGDYYPQSNDLVVGRTSGNRGISVVSATTGTGSLVFADGTGNFENRKGQIVYDHSTDSLELFTDQTERMQIDSSGRLLLGTSSSNDIFLESQLQIEGNTSAKASLSLHQNQSAVDGPQVILGKSRGSGSVGASDILGDIVFAGNDGTDVNSRGAIIRAKIDGTPGSNDLPTHLAFMTTADGASSPTERMRIDKSGRLLVGTSASLFGSNNIQSGNTGGNNFTAIRYSTGAGGAQLVLGHSQSGTIGSNVLLSDDDYMGSIEFRAADGTNYLVGAVIDAFVDGTPGTNDMPSRLVFSTTADGLSSPTERLRIDSSGNILANMTTSDLKSSHNFMTQGGFAVQSGASTGTYFSVVPGSANGDVILKADARSGAYPPMTFLTSNAEKMRLDASGRLLIGTSSYAGNGKLVTAGNTGGSAGTFDICWTGSRPTLADTDIGYIRWYSADNSSTNAHYASIYASSDGASSSGSDIPGRLVFATTANNAAAPTEQMRIDSSGSLLVGRQSAYHSSPGEMAVFQGNRHGVVIFQAANANYTCMNLRNSYANNSNNNVSGNMITFNDQGGTERGKITINGSSTNYVESSDYRLKENIVDITDGITRIKQLQPRRFNFIVDPDTTVDGFIAHEAQTVVPQSVCGIHNEVDDDGNAVMQGIDKSKLVPLLTAALQEAIAKIETLETKVATLEAG